METVLMASIIGPDWLKYGFIGLVAVINILVYLSIRPIIKSDPSKKSTPLIFIVTSLIFLVLGGLSSFHSDKIKFDNKRSVDSVEVVNMSLNKKLEILTDQSPESIKIRAALALNQKNYDSLSNVNKGLEHNIKIQKDLISDLVLKSIIQALESDMVATSGKSHINDLYDVNFKRLRRAVFLNLSSFNADPAILKQVLITYRKENDEPSMNDIHRIIKDLPHLMQVKLKWLQQEAIPTLEANINMLKIHPERQEGIGAHIKLPDEAIILKVSDENGGNKINIDDMAGLIKEKDLLAVKLSHL